MLTGLFPFVGGCTLWLSGVVTVFIFGSASVLIARIVPKKKKNCGMNDNGLIFGIVLLHVHNAA